MANYILVHGGDRDGSIWESVATHLRTQGHSVFCPSMIPIKKTTLQYNIDEISSLISHNHLNNVILVGHSYGAMVITGVLNKLAAHIRCMVYVDSMIPENGKSLYGLLAEQGLDYQTFGLTPDAPCIEPLYFDENLLKVKPKAYIYCLQSEFINVTTPLYKKMINNAQQDNWIYFNLDTIHGCMFTQPQQLAVILLGMQIF